jgi:hypothetical protein
MAAEKPLYTEETLILLARAARALNMDPAELLLKIRIAIIIAWVQSL